MIPTSVIGPLTISLGEYELTEPDGELVETGRKTDEVYVPLAHTEGSLSDSLYRGARAAAESGGFRTEVLRDRMTRASAFVCRSAEDAAALARWIEAELPKMREWLAGQRRRVDLPLREAARGRDLRRRARSATSCGRSRPAMPAGRT